MAGVLRPGLFPYEEEVEPLAFNIFQYDTLEAIIDRCAEAGRASEDRDEYAFGVTPLNRQLRKLHGRSALLLRSGQPGHLGNWLATFDGDGSTAAAGTGGGCARELRVNLGPTRRS